MGDPPDEFELIKPSKLIRKSALAPSSSPNEPVDDGAAEALASRLDNVRVHNIQDFDSDVYQSVTEREH